MRRAAALVGWSISISFAASSRSGSITTLPLPPSTSTTVPAGMSSTSAADHARDAELAGDDRGVAGRAAQLVASAITLAGSSPAVSAGARSSATSTDGTLGVGMPGSGSRRSSATTRPPRSRRSVTRSAIRPPMLLNIAANWSTAPDCSDAARPALRSWDSPRRPLSRARPTLAVSTSAATPGGLRGLARNVSATAATASS